MPGYLQLLFLLSVHVFKKEAVDMAIYEVHAGGRKDATNIFKQPVACGFTTIGLDHADLLGNTIQSIAGHKSGIMKRGTPAYSVVQPEAVAREVLEDEAMKLGCPLQFVEVGERLPDHPKLRLAVQKQNASLAIELVNAFLRRRDDELDEGDVLDGTLQCDWPGRFQRIRKGTTDWYLDIAHNCLSLPIALEWFRSEVTSSIGCSHASKRILIFGHESARDTQDLISTIARVCEQLELYFDLILLSPYKRYGVPVYESTVDEDAAYWRGIQPQTQIECSSSFKAAVAKVEKRRFQGSQILITGSTYLVGEALATLRD
ncbi:hypothetical protein VD0004_g5473 [Verticillium dahliae]|nr:hypothetical protein VD0004_g5473 [Verticillium dahliae]PNH72208.1 hypothetical protein VD0001_g5350 [Verticillium dahliae]